MVVVVVVWADVRKNLKQGSGTGLPGMSHFHTLQLSKMFQSRRHDMKFDGRRLNGDAAPTIPVLASRLSR